MYNICTNMNTERRGSRNGAVRSLHGRYRTVQYSYRSPAVVRSLTILTSGCRLGITRFRSPTLVQKGGEGGEHSEMCIGSESGDKQFGTSIPYVSWHQHGPMAVSGREGTGTCSHYVYAAILCITIAYRWHCNRNGFKNRHITIL